jgi:mannose-6-phosphate isomerase-like protein (cupin superfamily)
MSQRDREIVNPRTGQRMRFLVTAEESDGALLRLETHNPPGPHAEPLHVHPRQETRAAVVSGSLCFVVDGHERRIGPGEEIVIPAGVPHHFSNDGDEDAVAIQEARPALRLAEFFATYFALARDGVLDEDGRPPLLVSAALGPVFAEEIRLVTPPWPLQRAAYALLAPLARLRGCHALVQGVAAPAAAAARPGAT